MAIPPDTKENGMSSQFQEQAALQVQFDGASAALIPVGARWDGGGISHRQNP